MRKVVTVLVILQSFSVLAVQPSKELNSSQIKLALKKLTVLGSALHIAAHPDDENTSLLAYLSNDRLLRTGYLAITRGDGGQNLIGTEKGIQLGIIRTQELLAARSQDGAEQLFTRAVDFGYSKHPEETLEKWDCDKILADVVWAIRKFQPDIIITRFTPEVGGHGHHRASAILAAEAFTAAADPTRFPRQLQYADPWQAKRLVWNAWSRYLEQQGINTSELIKVDVGKFNPLLGISYIEIAAKGRTMHKSQGFGMSGHRGFWFNYFMHVSGDSAEKDLFEGIDLSWNRIPGGEPIGKILNKAYINFNDEKPEQSVPLLLEAYQEMESFKKSYWIEVKKKDLLEVIKACAGIWVEAITEDYSATPGSEIKINMGIVNRSDLNIKLKKIQKPISMGDTIFNSKMINNIPVEWKTSLTLPADIEYAQPYWLKKSPSNATFVIKDQLLIGLPVNKPGLTASFELSFGEQDIIFKTPVYYRWTDRVEGELYRSFEVIPKVSIEIPKDVYVFPDNNLKQIPIKLKAGEGNISGTIRLNLPPDWRSSPESISFNLEKKYEESMVLFSITPPAEKSEGTILAEAEIGNSKFTNTLIHINHPHIPIQTLLLPSGTRVIRLNLNKNDENIAYIMGSGDDIPESLIELGYNVSVIMESDLDNTDFSEFDVVITGIRAYNTNERLTQTKERLLEFVEKGGTLIDQYNTLWGLKVDHLGPYPFKISRDRVSVEEAPIVFIDEEHKLLNYPNKISQNDFNGWVQERGLYFANEWDSQYEPILSSHDPGEDPKEGGLLYTRYGKGHYIYSGYSWFRELPAGVSGAYRLFVNMVSVGSDNE